MVMLPRGLSCVLTVGDRRPISWLQPSFLIILVLAVQIGTSTDAAKLQKPGVSQGEGKVG